MLGFVQNYSYSNYYVKLRAAFHPMYYCNLTSGSNLRWDVSYRTDTPRKYLTQKQFKYWLHREQDLIEMFTAQ